VKRTPALWLDLAVKLSLVALLAFGAFSSLDRFAGKAFGWRLVGYSIAALVVPAIWAARGRRPPYPFVADTLFVLPCGTSAVGSRLCPSRVPSGTSNSPERRTHVDVSHHRRADRSVQRDRPYPGRVIHGLWLLPSSWDRWATLFEEAGYTALTPGWPDDPETVEEANANPEVFADKTIGQVADHYAEVSSASWSTSRP
jgi:hypothetical protein